MIISNKYSGGVIKKPVKQINRNIKKQNLELFFEEAIIENFN